MQEFKFIFLLRYSFWHRIRTEQSFRNVNKANSDNSRMILWENSGQASGPHQSSSLSLELK